jgi:hypothetical protein
MHSQAGEQTACDLGTTLPAERVCLCSRWLWTCGAVRTHMSRCRTHPGHKLCSQDHLARACPNSSRLQPPAGQVCGARRCSPVGVLRRVPPAPLPHLLQQHAVGGKHVGLHALLALAEAAHQLASHLGQGR